MSKADKTKAAKKSKLNLDMKHPTQTKKSKGYFWVRKPTSKAGSWILYFECWEDGKKQIPVKIPPQMYSEIGLKTEMTIEQARACVTDFNEMRKKHMRITLSQIHALQRVEDMKEVDEILFPKEYVEDFVNRLQVESDGKKRFKQRLVRNFEIVQKMTFWLNLRPTDYKTELALIVNYFKEQKYSVSYCKDILWVLNKWGSYYCRKKGMFFEPIKKLSIKSQNAITAIQRTKTGVRRVSLPIDEEVWETLRAKVDWTNLEETKMANWVFASWVLGLRPSECDAAAENAEIEYLDGIPILVVVQTKLILVDEAERIKRIPIITERQMEALNFLRRHQVTRPSADWVDQHCKTEKAEYGPIDQYDLYAGRKGFVDFIISPKGGGQSLEEASVYAGHKSMDTTWSHYKDRKSVKFQPTEFTEKIRKKAKDAG